MLELLIKVEEKSTQVVPESVDENGQEVTQDS